MLRLVLVVSFVLAPRSICLGDAGPLSAALSVPCSVFLLFLLHGAEWWLVMARTGHRRWDSVCDLVHCTHNSYVSTRLAGGVGVTPRRLLVTAVQRAWDNDNGIMG